MCLSLFFLIVYLDFLIHAVITQIFTVIAELLVFIGKPTNETNPGVEKQTVTVEAKINKCSV